VKGVKPWPKKMGRAWVSTHGWFWFSIGTDLYLFHLSLGPLSVAWERK
jgi:hypothetical protein